MPPNSLDDLGDLQKAVLETVWDLGEATVQQVRERLATERELAYTTVLTVLQKLEKAGWLRHRSEGRSYVYLPRRSRREAGQSALRDFTDRLFAGNPLVLFQHLLEDEQLTPAELDELKKMIERRRQETRHDRRR